MSKQSRTHPPRHAHTHTESSSCLACRCPFFVEEGTHSSFPFAHHPSCVPAELHSLEVHLRGETCDTGSFLYLDPRTTEKPNVGCTERLFCLLPCLQPPGIPTLRIAKDGISLPTMSRLTYSVGVCRAHQ